MTVTQTRHLWTLSQAALFYTNDEYRKIADHACKFLQDKMWDKEYGGIYGRGYYFKRTDAIIIANDAKVWWS